MRRYLHWRTLVLVSCVVFALQLSLVAQTPVKRPLSYDTYD